MGEIFVRTGRFPSEVLRLRPLEQAICLMAMKRTLEAEDAALQAIKRQHQANRARVTPSMTPRRNG